MTLKVTSGFFAVFSILASIIKGSVNDTLGQVLNLKLLVITHIATMAKKKEVFLLEFERLTQEMVRQSTNDDLIKRNDFIKQHLTDVDFITYESKMRDFITLDQVKIYTLEIVSNLSAKYDELQKLKIINVPIASSTPFQITDYVSGKTLAITFVGIQSIIIFLCQL